MTTHKAIREALEAVPLPHKWEVCKEPSNPHWFAGRTIGASDLGDGRRIADTSAFDPNAEKFATFIAACNPAAIRALLADLDAKTAEVEREAFMAGYAAQEQLYVERERHTAEVKKLQAEIRRLQALRPVQVSMNQDEVIAAIKSANISSSTTFWSIFEAGIRAAETHHHITQKEHG